MGACAAETRTSLMLARISALRRACFTGNLEVVHWLLQHGAPVDSSSPAGTPLLWAAGSGQDSAVSQLLAAGADVNATTADGISAVIMASAAGRVLTAPLHLCCLQGQPCLACTLSWWTAVYACTCLLVD